MELLFDMGGTVGVHGKHGMTALLWASQQVDPSPVIHTHDSYYSTLSHPCSGLRGWMPELNPLNTLLNAPLLIHHYSSILLLLFTPVR